MQSQTAVESSIARPSTYRAPEQATRDAESYIDPNATRWIFVPVQPITGLPGQDFGVWQIPENQFFPIYTAFPVIPNETGTTTTVPFTSQAQLAALSDLAASDTTPRVLIDLFKLSQLENAQEQEQILEVLTNPNKCSKYPFQLRNRCATCWRHYLATEAPSRVAEEFAHSERLFEAAAATLDQLIFAFDTAIPRAEADLSTALKTLDDGRSGKTALFDIDYRNIRNAHKDMPSFRTSTDQGGDIARLTEALTKTLTPQVAQSTGVTSDDVKSIVSEALSVKELVISEKDNEILRLRAQLAEAQAEKQPAPEGATALPSAKPNTGAGK